MILGAFFITNALLAEFIGIKIFSLEQSLGIPPITKTIFGFELGFELTAGVLLWPVVFVLTDIINEYYGMRGVRLLSLLSAVLISYAFVMVYFAIQLVPAVWWTGVNADMGIPDMNHAFRAVFGQGLWIIAGSLIAFLIGQLSDVLVFQRLRKMTGEGRIWIRATGSTLVSQLIDSFVVLFIAFYIGQDWSMKQVLAIGLNNYLYKGFMALALTPVLVGVHLLIDRYLGHAQAEEMKQVAAGQKN